jgi:hypothetical protein
MQSLGSFQRLGPRLIEIIHTDNQNSAVTQSFVAAVNGAFGGARRAGLLNGGMD